MSIRSQKRYLFLPAIISFAIILIHASETCFAQKSGMVGLIRHYFTGIPKKVDDFKIQFRMYAKGRKEATIKKRPLFIYFERPTSAWDVRQEGEMNDNPKLVLLINQRFIPIKVDGFCQPYIWRSFKVQYGLTTLIMDQNGAIAKRLEGYHRADDVYEELKLFLNGQERNRPDPTRERAKTSETIRWRTYSDGRKEAIAKNRLIFIFFEIT